MKNRNTETKSKTGFYVDTYSNGSYYLSGFPTREYRFRDYSDAYDVENMLKEKVKLPASAECDSESGQLFIYFKTKAGALSYLKRIEKYLDSVKELV